MRQNRRLWSALERLASLALPSWYLGAGCVCQSVWNVAHGREPHADIKDYDLVYFDSSDLSAEAERQVEVRAQALCAELDIEIDATNEAGVHRWYQSRFGHAIAAYRSTEDAIDCWPTTAAAVGVRLSPDDRSLQLYAPFGTDDLLALVVRANRVQVTRDVFEAKVERWGRIWPRLQCLPWNEGAGREGSRRLPAA